MFSCPPSHVFKQNYLLALGHKLSVQSRNISVIAAEHRYQDSLAQVRNNEKLTLRVIQTVMCASANRASKHSVFLS